MLINAGTFSKVSKEQYIKDRIEYSDGTVTEETAAAEYEKITIPQRATIGSAGYDFYLPFDVELSDKPVVIPTGIRAPMNRGWMLTLVPRSGLGFKAGLRLVNTLGIIDSDYCHAENEGHIIAKIATDEPLSLDANDRFIQGIFMQYGVTGRDMTASLNRGQWVLRHTQQDPRIQQRMGGMGSTGN